MIAALLVTHAYHAVRCNQCSNTLFTSLQARVEVGVLQLLNGRADVGDGHHIVRMRDFFVFRAHLCLVFELLSVNLYELIKHNQFRGLSMNLLRLFMTQVAALPPPLACLPGLCLPSCLHGCEFQCTDPQLGQSILFSAVLLYTASASMLRFLKRCAIVKRFISAVRCRFWTRWRCCTPRASSTAT